MQNEKNPARATKTTNYLNQLAKAKRTRKTGNNCVTIAEQGKTLKENREKQGLKVRTKTRKHPFWPQKISRRTKGDKKSKMNYD